MRASVLLLAGVAALAPVLGAQWVDQASAQAPRAQFAPPTTPMVLSRTVIRELSGGLQIVVKRSFRVQFVQSAGGFMLTGTPLDVSVEVPPALAKLGELERRRSEAGPFPILLDSRGMIQIIADHTDAERVARRGGLQAAQGMIEAAPMAGDRKREGLQLLGQLATDPRTSPWPSWTKSCHCQVGKVQGRSPMTLRLACLFNRCDVG